MHKRASLLLLTACISVMSAGCMVPQMAMNQRERGESFLEHGHYNAAVYRFTRAIEADDTDWRAYGGRARAHSRNLDLDDPPGGKKGSDIPVALADYDRAIALQPANAHLHLNRAVVRAIGGQESDALRDIDEAIRLNPSDGLSYGYRGLVLLRMGREAEAQPEFGHCMQRQPDARRELNGYIKRIKALHLHAGTTSRGAQPIQERAL
jgi:Flp pilus assembly protein TadD